MKIPVIPPVIGRNDWPRLVSQAVSLIAQGLGFLDTQPLVIPIGNVPDYANDAAAAAGGVAIGGVYRTGSALKIRVS